MKTIYILVASLLALVCVNAHATTVALPSPENSAQEIDAIAAIVNNDTITLSELSNEMEHARLRLKKQSRPVPPEATLRNAILQQMINRRLILQIAKRADVKITDKQLNQAIANAAKSKGLTVPAFIKQMHDEGYTTTAFKRNVREELTISLIQNQYVGKDIHVKKSEINRLMKKFRARANDGVQYHVVDILIPIDESANSKKITSAKQEAADVMQHLNAGAALEHVADDNTNDLGWRSPSDLPEVFANKIRRMSTNEYAGPFRTSNGYHIIALVGKRGKAGEIPPRAKIENMLYQRETAKAMQKWIKSLRKQAYIRILHS